MKIFKRSLKDFIFQQPLSLREKIHFYNTLFHKVVYDNV